MDGLAAPSRDPRFVLEDFEPVYLDTWRRGLLPEKVEAGLEELRCCELCPRNCRVDRLKDGVPMRRGGDAEEVARVILWLASDDASYTTGALVDCAGGR